MYCPFCGRSANSVVVSILPSKAAPLLRLSSATPHEPVSYTHLDVYKRQDLKHD